MDHASRTTERQARAHDDPEARRRVLVDRLLRRAEPLDVGRCPMGAKRCVGGTRKGLVTDRACAQCHGTGRLTIPAPERIALAAYCGDEWAREVVPVVKPGGPQPDRLLVPSAFRLWTNGLSRWPGALKRAALTASKVALPVWERNFGFEWTGADSLQRNAVDAAAAWIQCPCEQHLSEWWEASDPEHPDPELAGGGSFETWVMRPWDVAASVERGSWSGRIGNLPHRVLAAARLTGEATVRHAIQRRLIGWALGEDE